MLAVSRHAWPGRDTGLTQKQSLLCKNLANKRQYHLFVGRILPHPRRVPFFNTAQVLAFSMELLAGFFFLSVFQYVGYYSICSGICSW